MVSKTPLVQRMHAVANLIEPLGYSLTESGGAREMPRYFVIERDGKTIYESPRIGRIEERAQKLVHDSRKVSASPMPSPIGWKCARTRSYPDGIVHFWTPFMDESLAVTDPERARPSCGQGPRLLKDLEAPEPQMYHCSVCAKKHGGAPQ